MSTSYTSNPHWNQQQAMYNQTQQGTQGYNFSPPVAPNTNGQHVQQDAQSQAPYNGYQYTNNGTTSPDMLHPGYSNTQPQPPTERRNGSFGTTLDTSPTFQQQQGGYPQSTSPGSSTSFNPQYNTPSPEQLGWSNPAAFSFSKPQPTNGTAFPTTSFDGSGGFFSSSPTGMQDHFPQSTHMNNNYASPSNGTGKRQHDSMDDADEDAPSDPKAPTKAKPSGACARCKSLKVKCEFKTDNDPCKRCLNSGNECIIPGRKKRRTPPKREHLLNQIREQADQIKSLMAQLDGSGRRSHRLSATSESMGSTSDVQSPELSSDFTLSNTLPTPENAETNKVIEDWIAKAKQSFQDFDQFIGVGGASMPKSYIISQDLENPNGSDDDEFYEALESNDDYDITVEHHDADVPVTGQTSGNGSPGKLRHRLSSASISTNGTTGAPLKKSTADNEVPATLPGGAAPFGLFGKMSLQSRASVEPESEQEKQEQAGIARPDFFKPTISSDSIKKSAPSLPLPLILQRKVVSPQEAERLFDIYFKYMNLSLSLLDPVLYTAQRTCFRSPFLFTVICGIASRFYSDKPELYVQVMHYAQQAAGSALISGPKNVDMVAAYILLSLYPVPVKRWEDQRGWLYLGLAIRTATDLNLHLPNTAKPLNENHAREMLNRTRIWLNCYNLDRSTGSQYGKPPIINPGDYTANKSENWWHSSPYNIPEFDIHLSAYNAELKVMAAFIGKIYGNPDHPTGLKKDVDFEKIASETDEEIKQLSVKWLTILDEANITSASGKFRTGLLRLAYPYARLVALSYGFQHAFGKNNTDENPFLNRCLDAAFDVVEPVLRDMRIPENLTFIRHGPEAQIVFVSFASAFLVKLLQPKFAAYVPLDKRYKIRELVGAVVEMFSSPEVVVDERHALKLYSKFLKNLLAAPMARVDPLSPPVGTARKARQLAGSSSRSTPEPQADPNANLFSSATSRGSLSPAARASALSFSNFTPVGGLDPYVPENSLALHMGNGVMDDGSQPTMIQDYFNPPLPFDDGILQSMESLSDPSGWQDTTMSVNLAWSNFTNNFDMDYGRNPGYGRDQFMS